MDYIYYAQTGNNTAAHNTIFGGPLTASGSPDGSSANPWSSWSTIAAKINETTHASDTLTIRLHPACFWSGEGANIFQSFSNLGTAGKWASIKIERWEDKVAEQPLYALWKPGWDTLQPVTSGQWERGSVVAGAFVPGAGDVYRYTTTITDPYSTIRCWGGHEIGDMRAVWSIAGRSCAPMGAMSVAGDYFLSGASPRTLYVKTGDGAANPTQKWGSFCFITYADLGYNSLDITNAENVTFQDVASLGGILRFKCGAGTNTLRNIKLIRARQKMGGLGSGLNITAAFNTDSRGYGLEIIDPDLDAGESIVGRDIGVMSERSAQNGVHAVGNWDGILITNPKISGYSHGQIQILPSEDYTLDKDYFPRNVEIRCDDTSDGKCVLTGGPNYQRGFNLNIAYNGRVGPLKHRNMTVMNQVNGRIDFQTQDVDPSNLDFSDPLNIHASGGKYHINSGFAPGSNAFLFSYANARVRFFGAKIDLTNIFAFTWGSVGVQDTILIRGSLIRDAGLQRWVGGFGSPSEFKYTRRAVPIAAAASQTPSDSPYQSIKDNLFILAPACVGMASFKPAGQTQNANGTSATQPVIQHNETVSVENGSVNWTAARVSGNRRGTEADFGFDASLAYIGPRLTPVQTGARVGRGYR
jgi:hypothetical protein